MKKNILKPSLILGLSAFAVYLLYILLSPKEINTVNIHFLDVGQGDSSYIELPKGQNVLIDGGPDSSALNALDRLIAFYNREIDTVILTHPHADHMAGLEKIINKYQVGTLYLTEEKNDTPEYQSFLSTLGKKNITIQKVKAGDKILFPEGIELKFLNPKEGQESENINDSSIVAEISWGQKKALFMGDIESEAQAMLRDHVSEVQLLKVAHHCSADAVNSQIYQILSPEYSVISVGQNNKFGHPSEKCLGGLIGSDIYRTDRDGRISFIMSRDELRPEE